jgi:hypothetical protein
MFHRIPIDPFGAARRLVGRATRKNVDQLVLLAVFSNVVDHERAIALADHGLLGLDISHAQRQARGHRELSCDAIGLRARLLREKAPCDRLFRIARRHESDTASHKACGKATQGTAEPGAARRGFIPFHEGRIRGMI